MKQLKSLLFVALLALLAWNCQKEETSIPQEDTAQTEQGIHRTTFWELPSHIRDQVSSSSGAAQGKGPSGKGGEPFGEVLQDQVDVLETPDGTTSYTLGMEKLADGAYMDNLVVTEDMDGTLDTHILRYRPSDGWLAERASGDVGWGAYSGEIFIFDGEGNPKAAGVFNNGQVTGQATGKGTAAKEDVMDCVVTEVSYGGVVLDGVFHVTDIIIDYECSGGGGDGLEPGPGLPNGGGQLPQGGGQPQGGGGQLPQGGGGNQIPTLVDDRLVFEKIDVDESVDPCVVGIINKLALKDMQRLTVPDIGGLQGAGHLSQGILDLFDKSGDYDLVFKVADTGRDSNGNPRNATTVGSSDGRGNFTFTITIDDDYVKNATQLAIARTIIHESVHAYLGHVLQKNFLSDTAQLLREYKDRFGSQNIAEHTFMTQYAEAIGYSLSVWAGDIHNQEYYQNLAWSGGLLETEAYKKLSSSKKLAIQNANIAEGNAISRATSNARGTKCK